MSDTRTNPIDPLETVGLREMISRANIPRTTIMKWLAEDETNNTPGQRFPRPLPGHKLRWNVLAVTRWFERHHAGEKVA